MLLNFRSPELTESGPSPVTWPKFTEQEQEYLVFDVKPRVDSRYQAQKVAFWNEMLPKLAEVSRMEKKKNDEKALKDEL